MVLVRDRWEDRVSGTQAMHPRDDSLVDEDGEQKVFVVCPDCGQMEWWTLAETEDHGLCRHSDRLCPDCLEEV